jgi:circadian clock protein KaiC
VSKLPTGIAGLDVVLDGGFERGSVVLVAGPPGAGKTILAQQICFSVVSAEHRALYYTTLSEPHAKLVRHLQPFDFFDAGALETRVEHLHLGDLLRSAGEDGLQSVVAELVRRALDDEPAVIVVDSAKLAQELLGGVELRAVLYDLTSRIAHTDTVLLLLGEYTPEEMSSGVEFSLADAIIQLSYEQREPVDRRSVRVVKLRGGRHVEGKHTFRITNRGLEVFPRIETQGTLDGQPFSGRIPSGTADLDELMGGGIGAGEATVVVGPSGVGKTIFGMHFIARGLEDGERCLYVTFQDTPEQLTGRAEDFGWNLAEARNSGQLAVVHVPVGELDLDTLAAQVRSVLADGSVRRVVVDSLAELVSAARESDRFPAYARSLAGMVRSAGASLLVTSETTTVGEAAEPWEGLMFLFHNVILLRYVEQGSEVGRALNIIKMRNSKHDMGVHGFTLSDQGLALGARLAQSTGLLGWGPLRIGH